MKENKSVFTFEAEVPVRLDLFVSEQAPEYSRNLIQNLIKKGSVTVNGKIRKPAHILEAGDNVEVVWPQASNKTNLQDLVIYEDRSIFVINKPSGMLVHPQSPVWEENPAAAFIGDETLASMILANPPKYFQKNIARAGLVHRLDKDTSGVMMIAKNEKMQDALVEMFTSRQINKTYNAIVCGIVKDDQGIINVPIGRLAGGKIKASELGREAITKYKVIERKETATLVQLHPVTGRTNQLRVHMSWLGYPVLGDWLYEGASAPRLMLHAKEVSFEHPFTHKKVKFTVPAPADFKKAWKEIK